MTRAEVDAYIAARINDNSSGDISPQDSRESHGAVLDFVEQEIDALPDIPPLIQSLWVNDVLMRDYSVSIIQTDTALLSIVADKRHSIAIISLPNLTTISGDITVINCNGIGTLSLPFLEVCPGDITIENCMNLDTVEFDSLAVVNGDLVIRYCPIASGEVDLNSLTNAGGVSIEACPSVDSILLGSILAVNNFTIYDVRIAELQLGTLINCAGIVVNSCELLETVDISGLTNSSAVSVYDCELLEEILISNTNNCKQYNFSNNALTQLSVDNILLFIDAAGQEIGSLNLSGGTNSPPTGGAANANYLSLLSKNWDVNINS